MTRKWNWREGSHIRIDAQRAGRELDDIEKKEKKLTPALVLERARSSNSALHDHFEWSDGVAAEKYRLGQAGELIRSIQVVWQTSNIEKGREARAFVAVTRPSGEREFTPLATAMSDAELRKQVLARAWEELLAFKRKYAHLQELAAVFVAMEKVDRIA